MIYSLQWKVNIYIHARIVAYAIVFNHKVTYVTSSSLTKPNCICISLYRQCLFMSNSQAHSLTCIAVLICIAIYKVLVTLLVIVCVLGLHKQCGGGFKWETPMHYNYMNKLKLHILSKTVFARSVTT